MKKLFVIILSLLPHIGFAFEYSQVKFPEAQFQSISTYKSCTSYTPQITEVGATNIYGSQHSSSSYQSGMRKNLVDPNEPYLTPIGDPPYILMLLIIGFYIIRKKWKRMKSST